MHPIDISDGLERYLLVRGGADLGRHGSTMGANAPQWSTGEQMAGRRQRVVQAG